MTGNAENNILSRILASVREELLNRVPAVSVQDLWSRCQNPALPAPRGFRSSLQQDGIRVIAEVKRGSPSRGRFPLHRSPAEQAGEYAQAGAAAISVVTEPHFFFGSLSMLAEIRGAVTLPLLRKDFIVDSRQIYEARLAGADAVLLIAAALEDAELVDFSAIAESLGLDVLVEVGGSEELERALRAGARMIGVNNRDLRDFSTDEARSLALAPAIPAGITAVSESGIREYAQIERLRHAGYRGFLIGEHLMRQEKPGDALRRLLQADGCGGSAPCG